MDRAGHSGKPSMFFRVEHLDPRVLKRSRGDLSEDFSADNIAVSVYEMSRCPPEFCRKALYVDSVLHSASTAPEAFQVLNEAFFDRECYQLYTMEALPDVSFSYRTSSMGDRIAHVWLCRF